MTVLVLAMPMGDIEQGDRACSGGGVFLEGGKCNRLCPWRAGKCKGKPQPIVVDVVDEHIDRLASKYRRRMRFYKQLGTI